MRKIYYAFTLVFLCVGIVMAKEITRPILSNEMHSGTLVDMMLLNQYEYVIVSIDTWGKDDYFYRVEHYADKELVDEYNTQHFNGVPVHTIVKIESRFVHFVGNWEDGETIHYYIQLPTNVYLPIVEND